jgi:hypothetical protein
MAKPIVTTAAASMHSATNWRMRLREWQAGSLFDGFSFDLFPPFENGLTASEVDVSRR